jgi:hypothetical protein
VTDADGVITYYNPACVAFAGRVPALGQDRWCVTWKLYTEDGAFLPHDQCPMADAILTQTPVRGLSAIAERPDGTRLNFLPFPTPLFDAQGQFIGAVNMLIDVTASKRAAVLREQARRCRRLAISIDDEQTASTLNGLAAGYRRRSSLPTRALVNQACWLGLDRRPLCLDSDQISHRTKMTRCQ